MPQSIGCCMAYVVACVATHAGNIAVLQSLKLVLPRADPGTSNTRSRSLAAPASLCTC
jgi:hypothetical protein